MRSLSSSAAAALAGSVVVVATLVEMDLTDSLFLNTSPNDITINGVEYFGTGGLGQIDSIQETSSDYPQVGFTLAGVDPTMISLALQEPVQGKAVRIKLALFDSSTGALLDVRLRYAGRLDVMTISDGIDTASIRVTSESCMLDLLRPANVYYNDADQQLLQPGDLSMQYVNDQVDKEIIWPNYKYFTK